MPDSSPARSGAMPRFTSTPAQSSTDRSVNRTVWQRDSIVGSSAPGASEIRKNMASPGGVSSVFSSAFWALGVSRSACSMMAMCLPPS